MEQSTEVYQNLTLSTLQAVTVQEGGIPGAVAQTSQSEGTPSVTVSQLHFPSVQPHHAGLYVCLAANTPGTARATLSLRVMCEYRLQALVYDILPSTNAVFSYAIGSRKLSVNEQLFCCCWCSNSSRFVTNNSDYIRRLFYN